MAKFVDSMPNSRSYMLEKFALGAKNYWMAFIADSLTAIFFIGWQFLDQPRHPATVLLSLFGGYFSWTLTEYIFHRWVYHQEKGIFGEGHRIHHTEAKTLIAMPWFLTTLTMFALWHYVSRVLGIPFFAGVLAGWLAGFVFYSMVHHSHHHWSFKFIWFRKLKAYHRIHHHFPAYNYGVTMRFWDIAFGTRYQKNKVEQSEPQIS